MSLQSTRVVSNSGILDRAKVKGKFPRISVLPYAVINVFLYKWQHLEDICKLAVLVSIHLEYVRVRRSLSHMPFDASISSKHQLVVYHGS